MLPSGDSVSPRVVGLTPATLGDAPLHGYAAYLFIDKREKGERNNDGNYTRLGRR